jgi:hypothetical protein
MRGKNERQLTVGERLRLSTPIALVIVVVLVIVPWKFGIARPSSIGVCRDLSALLTGNSRGSRTIAIAITRTRAIGELERI